MRKIRFLAVIAAAILFLCAFSGCPDNKQPAPTTKLAVPQNLQISGKTLTWNVVSNASGYTVDIDGAQYSTASNSYSLSALSDYKTYTVKVRANGNGTTYTASDWSGTIPYTLAEPDPNLPQLNSPTGLAIENKMLTWTAVSDAAGYAVEIDGASHSASGASYSLSPLTAAKTYAIRVRAIGDGVNFRNSDWSAPVSYTVESSNPPSGNIDSMSCRQIVDYVFANVTQTQYIANRTPQEDWGWYSSTEQVRGTQVWFLGVNNVPFSEACAAESPMEPSDFSLVVIRLEASANAAQWRDSIYNGLSPMKWICAGADSKRVERIGSVIMAVIANAPDVDNLANAFFALGMAGESQPSGNIASMSCRQIVEHIYTNVPQTEYMQFRTPEEDWGWFLNTEQVRERCGWFLGVADIPFSEAFASEDGMGAAGFSLVVIKLESGANAVQWRDSIYNGLSPMKWVCMGGNAKRVERIGNVIMAVIANTPDIDSIVSAFNTLA